MELCWEGEEFQAACEGEELRAVWDDSDVSSIIVKSAAATEEAQTSEQDAKANEEEGSLRADGEGHCDASE